MTENIDIYKQQITQARTEIKNLRQHLSALKHEHLKEIKLIKSTLNGLRCGECAHTGLGKGKKIKYHSVSLFQGLNRLTEWLDKKFRNFMPTFVAFKFSKSLGILIFSTTIVTQNGEGPSTSLDPDRISFKPIGVIETSFQNKRGVPRQPSVLAKAKGTVIIDTGVFNNPEHALSGLEEFSHMWIIFHFHATESNSVPAKVAPPRLGGERRGVLSTRSPHRPCPIGLSLVKIQSIEGNKIHFLGVDMVTGTPVLDIKPYIPQYDHPTPFGDTAISTLVRPPTEGTSDGIELASLQIDDEGFNPRSLSPRNTNPIGIEPVSPLSRSPFEDDLPSPGNENSALLTPVSPSPDSPSSRDVLHGFNSRTPATRPDTERGAPDGQERFTPPQSALLCTVAPWITNPPSQRYEVRFTDEAFERLTGLIGTRAQVFKSNIETLLSEDPRSQYVKTRYPDHEYNCVLEDMSISCVFDVNTSVCTIIAVRSADDLQN